MSPNQAAVLAGIAHIEQDYGPIDVLVNNAGIQRRGPLEDFPAETWHEVMRTNLGTPCSSPGRPWRVT